MEKRSYERQKSRKTKKKIKLTVKDDRRNYRNKKVNTFKIRDRRMRLVTSFLTVVILLTLLSLSFLKKSHLNNKKNEYNSLQADNLSLQLQKDRLYEKLESSIDLNRIQRYALEELGMVYKDENNTVKVNVDRN